jgi:hypothetical protein
MNNDIQEKAKEYKSAIKFSNFFREHIHAVGK